MKPLKLAVFSYHTCPLAFKEGKETGGLNIYVYETSKYLASQGIHIDVFTRSQDAKQPHVVNVTAGFRVIHIVAGPEIVLSKEEMLTHLKEFYANVLHFIKKEKLKYDLIHAHYYMSGIAGLWFKREFGIPIVMTFHTLGLMKNLVARDPSEIADATRIRTEFELVKKSDIISATSPSDARYLTYLYDCPPEKIHIVPPGVDTKLFTHMEKNKAKKIIGADADHKVILSVGRTEQLKGYDVLLYALKILFVKNPIFEGRTCVWIVGGSETKSPASVRLEEIKQILGLRTSVITKSQQTQDLLPYYYNAAEVVVMPSHYESFGMVALEALACGIPVIASNVSGVSQIISHDYHGLIMSSQNPLLLAKQLEHILTQNHFSENRKDIRDLAKLFTWKKTGEKLNRIYSRNYTQ